MNVMYSDSNGNLGTTTDLGLQNLTVSSDSSFGGNVGIMGKVTSSSADVSGKVTASSADVSGKVKASSADVSGLITSTDASITGKVTASSADISGIAIIGSNLNVNGKVLEKGNALMPSGVIVMWGGAADKIPAGWVLCDGGNGSPNLRGLFIVGAGPGSYGVGATGGVNEVTLSVAQMPIHTHDMNWPPTVSSADGQGSWSDLGGWHNGRAYNTLKNNNTGGNQPHENRPPYYALCYIMKI
jgi:hypothetical protein